MDFRLSKINNRRPGMFEFKTWMSSTCVFLRSGGWILSAVLDKLLPFHFKTLIPSPLEQLIFIALVQHLMNAFYLFCSQIEELEGMLTKREQDVNETNSRFVCATLSSHFNIRRDGFLVRLWLSLIKLSYAWLCYFSR